MGVGLAAAADRPGKWIIVVKYVNYYQLRQELLGKGSQKKKKRKTDKCQFCPYTYLCTVNTNIFSPMSTVEKRKKEEKTNISTFSAQNYLPKTNICQFCFLLFLMTFPKGIFEHLSALQHLKVKNSFNQSLGRLLLMKESRSKKNCFSSKCTIRQFDSNQTWLLAKLLCQKFSELA